VIAFPKLSERGTLSSCGIVGEFGSQKEKGKKPCTDPETIDLALHESETEVLLVAKSRGYQPGSGELGRIGACAKKKTEKVGGVGRDREFRDWRNQVRKAKYSSLG